MQEFIAFNEQRAEIYWWMSSLFARELTDADLHEYHGGEMYTFLSGLGMTEELKAPVEAFREVINQSNTRPDEQLELAADFCGLFLSTPKTGALPYASMYVGTSGLLNDKPAQDMNVLMNDYAIAQRKEFNEPADHLAVELDFMGNLIIMANQQETEEKREELMQAQLSFINTMLLNWLPLFVKECQNRDQFGFYAAAANLLLAFCKLDAAFLAGE
ncbi:MULTISPECIES: molecular chaperone TorD [unclassified Photobacterium]|uniref:molecular chaperone TorD n=1 Tax=unclassified Photobacterium TaxID=2628852 RepID=UPI000D174A2E|nr:MULTISPECIES: molecular chaperone TorD [unclassified Photobacterium]PSV28426.1 molecular chaperone TorD [Photobacterium sp. GB-56]PSV30652.1 molecular chaperone TorD [Photobacterium sp. GB-72]PSV40214.1 molecular chaperone TorD [Photobacterium sp. GB-210]PSV56372.1 molecular chaperone TorD [Photobacterium sp. GB-3]PSW72314.1 molecular chaperone TorD [Photobacterium sp. GB-50]